MEIDMKKSKTCNNCRLRGFRALDILAGFEDYPFCLLLKRNVVDGNDQCHVAITDEDIEAARKEVEAKREIEDSMTRLSCSFALNNGNGTPLPDTTRYWFEGYTIIPGSPEGRALHFELNEDAESNTDEVNSLDNTIDECFCEMKRLIEDGMNVGVDLAREKSKTAYVFLKPIDSVELETAKSTIDKLTKENKENKDLIANLEEAISNCLGPYGKNNEDLRDENKILQQEVALLKEKLKRQDGITNVATCRYSDISKKYLSLAEERNELKGRVCALKEDFAAVRQENDQLCMELDMVNQDLSAHRTLNMDLEGKISQIHKELSDKWLLLEVGEKPKKGDQEFLCMPNGKTVWVEISETYNFGVKSYSSPVRRKITI